MSKKMKLMLIRLVLSALKGMAEMTTTPADDAFVAALELALDEIEGRL